MTLSWTQLDRLAATHGDAFYLVDLARFQANYMEFQATFRAIYTRSQIAYSYKTNYTPRLCQLVNQLGGYAEVVSGMEYALACRVGTPPARIIFNGPFKRLADLQRALLAGAIVNLDSPYEVALVEQIAKAASQTPITVGVRCHFDVGPKPSRFGFDVMQPTFARVLDRLRSLDNCRLAGLHCHFLAPQRSAAAYGAIAERMLDLAADHFADAELDFIDLGGGFFSKMTPALQAQFGQPIPTFAEYAAAMATPFAQRFGHTGGPQLILEPGIALTADVMQLAARVIDWKTVGGRTVALVASSIYEIKPTLNQRNLPLTVFTAPTNEQTPMIEAGDAEAGDGEAIDLVGYTCMEDDCLYRGFTGRLAPGDFVVFDNVGAYTNVLKPPFINPAPPMVGYGADGDRVELLRRRETVEDLFATYCF
jgi:diaminopimelate decarboxylase